MCCHCEKDYEKDHWISWNGSDAFELFSKGLTSQTHHLQKLGEKGDGNCSTGGSSAMGLLELEVFMNANFLPLHWERRPSHCFPIVFAKLYHRSYLHQMGLCFCPPCRWCSIHSYSNPYCRKLVPWIIYQMPVIMLLKATTVEGATVVVHEPFYAMWCNLTKPMARRY